MFYDQLQLAKKFDLPVILHLREAYCEGLDILSNYLSPYHPIHLHCFTEEYSVALDFIQRFPNLKIGITGLVNFKSADCVRKVAKWLPMEKVLLETDAPYFGKNRNEISLPQDIFYVAEELGRLRSKPTEWVLQQNIENSREIYRKFFLRT